MIIFLNGPSSSGKTSLARAIQKNSNVPFLRIGIDTLIDMMPVDYWGDGPRSDQGFSLCSKTDEDGVIRTTIHMGLYGDKVSKTVPHMVKLLADFGHNVIVDEVLLGENYYGDILKDHKVYYIGVMCDVKVMEEREKLRGNRCLGMAREQSSLVHNSIKTYDMMVDTTHVTSENLAKNVLAFCNAMSS